MSATCEKCSDTGMLPGSKFLDCTSCDTAMIRVGLETWATENGIVADDDELWVIFKYGQSVALEEAAKVADGFYQHIRQYTTDVPAIGSAIRALK